LVGLALVGVLRRVGPEHDVAGLGANALPAACGIDRRDINAAGDDNELALDRPSDSAEHTAAWPVEEPEVQDMSALCAWNVISHNNRNIRR
jgi:hypothetical protein